MYTDTRTWFYGIVCAACERVFYEEPHDDLDNLMPCPGCGQVHPESEPTLAEAATVLAKSEDSRLDATMIRKAASFFPGYANYVI